MIIDARAHDERVAWVSHLPQFTASAVAVALSVAGRSTGELGPGGRDVTRLAASSPEMWAATALSNREPLLRAVRALGAELSALEGVLHRSDREALLAFLRAGRDWRS